MKVILDVDPGTDDALAIMMALNSTDLQVEGLTTVGGNATLRDTTRNTLRLLEHLRVDVRSEVGDQGIPVSPGASRPLTGRYNYGYYYHGPAGLGVRLPSPDATPYPVSAPEFIVDLAESGRRRATLVALGPLTNVARALRSAPGLTSRLKQIVVMGGAAEVPGNITPHAEFNTYNDPRAARAVFDSDVPVTLVPLDVCTETTLTREDLPWVAGNSRTGRLAQRVLYNWFGGHPNSSRYDLCDPLALVAALRPDLFDFQRASVTVETDDPERYGNTTASYGQGNVNVALGVDAGAAKALMLELLNGGS
jgi:inosine-uridine nucleoside N-ribohydrolase